MAGPIEDMAGRMGMGGPAPGAVPGGPGEGPPMEGGPEAGGSGPGQQLMQMLADAIHFTIQQGPEFWAAEGQKAWRGAFGALDRRLASVREMVVGQGGPGQGGPGGGMPGGGGGGMPGPGVGGPGGPQPPY